MVAMLCIPIRLEGKEDCMTIFCIYICLLLTTPHDEARQKKLLIYIHLQ